MKQIQNTKNFLKQNWVYLVFLMVIFFAGGVIRFWQLGAIPPGLHYDEARHGIDAIKVAETGNVQVFSPDSNSRAGLYHNFIAVIFSIFGEVNTALLRTASAVFGLLAIIGFPLLARELKLSKATALLGTFMMAFSFWHLNFSRLAYPAILVPFLLIWIFYFLYLGFRKKNFWFIALSGLLTGIGFYTHASFQVMPLILILVMLATIFSQKGFVSFLKAHWKRVAIFAAATAIALAPMSLHFHQNQGNLPSQNSTVSVLNAPNATFIESFGKSLGAHIGSFFFFGDPNQRHNHAHLPLIPAVWSILFGLGFFITAKEIVQNIAEKIKQKKKFRERRLFRVSVFAQAVFWVMLIPGVLSVEGIPHAMKIIGTIPAVFLITALPFEYALNLFQKIQNSENLELKPWRWRVFKTSVTGLIILVLAAGFLQSYMYFKVWARDGKTLAAFERNLYDLGLTIKQSSPKKNNYAVVPEQVRVSENNRESSLKTTEFVAYPEYQEFLFVYPIDALKNHPCENSLYIFAEADQWLIQNFEKKCPELEAIEFKPKGAVNSFWMMR